VREQANKRSSVDFQFLIDPDRATTIFAFISNEFNFRQAGCYSFDINADAGNSN